MVSGADPKGRILLEDGLPEEVAKALNDLGHHQPTIVTGWARSHFGVGQIITRAADGVLCAGSDPRHDGQAIGY
jgi:gamma-glutamyltranspeptidase/glutathione hydrolase